MSSSMHYSLVGDDRLSPVLTHAGDTAVTMAGRISLAATEADLAMAGLTRDLEYQVRDARGAVIPESEALGRAIGAHVRGGLDETLSSLHPEVQIDADSRPADAEVAALFRRMETLRDARIGVDIPVDDVLGEITAIRGELDRLGRTHADPDVRIAADRATRTLAAVRAEVSRLDTDRATIDVDIDAARALAEAELVEEAVRHIGDNDGPDRAGRRFGGLRSAVGSVVGVLGRVGSAALPLAKIGAMIGAGIPAAASLVTTLENVAPAAGVAVTGVIALVAANAALKIGMIGVGDAVKKAFDPGTKAKDLDKALNKLAPQARSFVLALRGLKPQFDSLKLSVQGELFTEMDSVLKKTAKSTLPVLKTELTSTATAVGNMGAGVAFAAKGLADDGTLGLALHGASSGLMNLSRIPGQIVKGLVQVGASAAPSFDKLTAIVGTKVTALSGRLSKSFQYGSMETSIERAISLVGQLGGVFRNIGTIVSNVLAQAGTAGAGVFGLLGTVTSALAKASAMPGVQAAFGDLFEVMGEIGKVAGPLLVQAFRLVAPVITALAPPVLRLIDSLGAGLQPILTALGPVLVVAATAVGSLLDAASPLLPIVGQMVASLGGLLTPVIKIIGGAFTALAPVFLQLGQQLLPPFVKLIAAGGQAFALLAPVLQTALTQLGTQGLIPILTGLGTVLSQVVTQYSAAFLGMFQQLLPVIPQLIPVLVQVGQSVGQILTAVAPLVPQLALMGVQFVTSVLPAVLPLIPPLAQLTVLLLQLATGVITHVVVPVLAGLTKGLQGLETAFHHVMGPVTAVTKGIVGAFKWAYDLLLGHSIIPDLVNGVVSWLTGLPGKAAGALAGLAGQIGGKAREAANRLISEVRTGLTAAVSWLSDLPGRAADAVGDLSGTLTHAGKALLDGLVGGIKSGFGSVKSTLGDLTSHLTDWKGPPAKDKALLTPAGRLLILGLIAGIDASTPQLKTRLNSISTLIERAIEINKGNRHKAAGLSALSDMVERDNKRLLGLAQQRDKIAATIAAAKSFAADTAATARGTASLSSLGEDAANKGAGGILTGLQSKLQHIRQFTGYIGSLAKRGLSKDLLREILQMGPDAGFAYAQSLAGATTSTLAAINRTQGAINQAARGLGDVGADRLYDSGKDAGKGFLAGLASQEKAIEALMVRIARSMTSTIRRELGMRSPSTVLARDGAHAVEGVEVGALSRLPALGRAMSKVAATVAGTPLGFGAVPTAPASAGRAAPPAIININISGALDPVAVAREIRRVLLELKRVYGLNIDLGLGGAAT